MSRHRSLSHCCQRYLEIYISNDLGTRKRNTPEPIYSDPSDIFLVSEMDRHSLTYSPNHAGRGGWRAKEGMCPVFGSTSNPRASSRLAMRTDISWRKVLIMRYAEQEEGEEEMCPVIESEALHFQPTNVLMPSGWTDVLWCKVLNMRTEETEEVGV